MPRRLLPVLCLLPLLGGCATGPSFPTDAVNTELQAREASRAGDAVRGEQVVWGGRIIHTEPEAEATRIEVLAYPLRRNQQPNTNANSEGRFLVLQDGFLEPADYAPNRLITVSGTLQEPRRGRVGDAEYLYPVVRADSVYLWPEEQPVRREEPRVRFGVGVIISR